jgi:hypothetical protein
MTPSSMVAKFTRKEDLKQACYEATLDLNLYIVHLEDIARRSEENFPEIAAGLRGTTAGIAQYLRGVDGEWRTRANVDLHEYLSQPDFLEHMWAYEFCRDPRAATMLMGCLAAVACSKPDLNFWEALRVAKVKLMDFEPLIEQLLASSPLRKPQ